MLTRYFGAIPAGPKPEPMTTVEPKQIAVKSAVIKEPTQPSYFEGYHRPDYRDPDDSVYDAISDILSNGRTGRLYRSLVRDQKIAQAAEGGSGFPGYKYPNLFYVFARPLPGHTNAELATAIHKELDRLKTEDVTDQELAEFKTRNRVDTLRGLADNDGLAHQLAEYQTRFGDWRQLFLELDQADRVTKADIRRVAGKVFIESNRTTSEIEFQPPPQPAAQGSGGAQ
jgi:predicted Zn-dependent peptidase